MVRCYFIGVKTYKVQAPLERVAELFNEVNHDLRSGESFCTRFGAKVRYLKGGWWQLSGYDGNGADTDECINVLCK